MDEMKLGAEDAGTKNQSERGEPAVEEQRWSSRLRLAQKESLAGPGGD